MVFEYFVKCFFAKRQIKMIEVLNLYEEPTEGAMFWSSKSRHFVFTVFILNRTHISIGSMKSF